MPLCAPCGECQRCWAVPSISVAQDFDFPSANGSEFSARATGGVRFVTSIDTNGAATAGATLTPGAGSWTSLRDRNAKEKFQPLDAELKARDAENAQLKRRLAQLEELVHKLSR